MMTKQGVISLVLLATMFCGAVTVGAAPTHPLRGYSLPDEHEQVALPDAPERPLMLAQRGRHEWRHERRREWRHEARKEWRRERRSDAVAAGVGGLIIGGALGAAAANSQRQQYQQDMNNYPSYGSGYPYPR